MRPIERGRLVQAMGRYLLEHKDAIAGVLTLEQGKPLWESHIEVEGAARYFEYYGNQASTVEGRSIPLGAGYFDWTEYEPFGVSAQIIPWNYPVEMTARSLSAALATGNACVIKSPELTRSPTPGSPARPRRPVCRKGRSTCSAGWGMRPARRCPGIRGVNQIVFTGSVPPGIAIATARRRTWCLACWNWAANRRPSSMTTPISMRSRMTSAGASISTPARSVRP
jgi:aldehyde dehydrogenase (NAD+)